MVSLGVGHSRARRHDDDPVLAAGAGSPPRAGCNTPSSTPSGPVDQAPSPFGNDAWQRVQSADTRPPACRSLVPTASTGKSSASRRSAREPGWAIEDERGHATIRAAHAGDSWSRRALDLSWRPISERLAGVGSCRGFRQVSRHGRPRSDVGSPRSGDRAAGRPGTGKRRRARPWRSPTGSACPNRSTNPTVLSS